MMIVSPSSLKNSRGKKGDPLVLNTPAAPLLTTQVNQPLQAGADLNNKMTQENQPLQAGADLNNKMTQIFTQMFTDPMRKDTPCPCSKQVNEEEVSDVIVDAEGLVRAIPKKKTNYYEKKKMGWEASAYFFDYIDPVFQKEISDELRRIFLEAQKISPPQGFKDPYSLEGILGINLANKPSEGEMMAKLKSLWPAFNENMWRASITTGQIASIIEQWSWNFDTSNTNPAKTIVDKFDFNGDGRLNTREFLLAMIENNKKVIDGAKKCKNCMENIIMNKIDPLFMYIDCASMNIITAEEIWNALPKLKRNPVKGFDIFNCHLESGKYRTSAINDFILKAHKIVDGKITKEEFRHGILMGYWDRQTDETEVFSTDAKNLKMYRWDQTGETDIICSKIQASIRKSHG
jgi:hypothetical protein